MSGKAGHLIGGEKSLCTFYLQYFLNFSGYVSLLSIAKTELLEKMNLKERKAIFSSGFLRFRS